MDYHRIYSEFIKDRFAKQQLRGWQNLQRPKRGDYFEKHHVVPRCIGGGNEPTNIIRLTPDDHFFAHLLLAKMYGGRLWAAFQFMLDLERYKPIVARRNYGWVARAIWEAKSGFNSPQYDWTIHELENRTGQQWRGTQAEMHSAWHGKTVSQFAC